MPTTIAARQALTVAGWRNDIVVCIAEDGRISAIEQGSRGDVSVGVLLPAPCNLHSHSFQRALAGLTERRAPDARDNFWSWRKLMYRFLQALTPEDFECIAAQAQMEMLEAGYAAQAEFYYVHHAPDGSHYDQLDELSHRHLVTAQRTGIGYTHLPVLYARGGVDNRPLEGAQRRFGCSVDQFEKLHSLCLERLSDLPADFRVGVAAHSLRAVSPTQTKLVADLGAMGPKHIHAAEQTAEVEEVRDALGAPPVRWLLDELGIDATWCIIHATHLDDREVTGLAKSGAVAGLCPITEANLGDGLFRAPEFAAAGGRLGIGTDSNVQIEFAGELRLLELGQRLLHRRRAVLTDPSTPSNGRWLYDRALHGGAQALSRDSARIAVGAYADLLALDDAHAALVGLSGDALLDAWIMAGGANLVSDVWSAGRHRVQNGRHVQRAGIEAAFAETMRRLRAAL